MSLRKLPLSWSETYPDYDQRMEAMAHSAKTWFMVYMNCNLSLVPKD